MRAAAVVHARALQRELLAAGAAFLLRSLLLLLLLRLLLRCRLLLRFAVKLHQELPLLVSQVRRPLHPAGGGTLRAVHAALQVVSIGPATGSWMYARPMRRWWGTMRGDRPLPT